MSDTLDMAALYEQLQKDQTAKAEKEAAAAKDYNNPDFISMQAGKAYEVRLMYWASGVPGERIVPIIEKTVHAVKQDSGDYHEVTCPSSDYLMGRGGYRACPICTELSKLWKEMEKGSAAAKIAYKKFKRKFKGYAVVYVVNDPTTPENNNTFKILYVNAIVNNFLREEIKGVDKKGVKIEGARPIGFKAFDPTSNGKNLLVSVTKDGEFNNYTCKFVDPEGKGDLGVTKEALEKAYDDLKFDKYYTDFDPEALKKFYEDVYLEKETAPAAEVAPVKEKKAEEQSQPEAAAEVEKTDAKEEKVEEKPEAPKVDIDDILANLPG